MRKVHSCTSYATLGGFSGNLDYPGDLYMRDAFTWVAAHGTIEIQKMTAARGLFSSKNPALD